jgi:hypothetical protein
MCIDSFFHQNTGLSISKQRGFMFHAPRYTGQRQDFSHGRKATRTDFLAPDFRSQAYIFR